MTVALSTLGTRMTAATAATIATAIGGGTTAAEVTALIKFMNSAAARPDHTIPIMLLNPDVQLLPS